MRVGFAGTPAFAATILEAVLAAGFDVPLVLTQPDRPRGRGQKLDPSPVSRAARAHGLPVQMPTTLKDPGARAALLALPLDVLVVAAYGLILPGEVLAWPRHGCINVHASLLPRWRGAAPIERALLEGDAATGVTIMQMDAGLDTGPTLDVAKTAIEPGDTAGSVTEKLAGLGAAAIVRVLRKIAAGESLRPMAQPAAGITHAPKFGREDAAIAWDDANFVARQVRAFNPRPGAWASLGGETIKVWAGAPTDDVAGVPPGTVLRAAADGIAVACRRGVYVIAELQPANGRRMSAAAFVAGHRNLGGAVFAAPSGAAAPV
jgi:methionyl-tRNA formyltransferase